MTYNFGDQLGEFTKRAVLGVDIKSKNLRKSRGNFSKRKTYKGGKRRKSNKKSKKTFKK